MKILITGGAGYIGSKLIGFLFQSSNDYHITVYDNLMYNQMSLIQHIGNPNFKFIKGDVRDTNKLLKEVEKADKVIHLAAWVGAPMCEDDPRGAAEVNQYSTEDIAQHLSPDQDIIYPMSNSGYGVGGEDFCTEESPLNPISVYGTTKAESEKYVLGHPKSTVLRLATVFGPSPRPRIDLLVNDFTYKAHKDGYIVSNDKIEALGWKPKYSIEDGVKQLLEMFPIIDNVNYELRNS